MTLTIFARQFLSVLQAEAADAPVVPTWNYGPTTTLEAEGELIKTDMIERLDDGYYKLTPKGAMYS